MPVLSCAGYGNFKVHTFELMESAGERATGSHVRPLNGCDCLFSLTHLNIQTISNHINYINNEYRCRISTLCVSSIHCYHRDRLTR